MFLSMLSRLHACRSVNDVHNEATSLLGIAVHTTLAEIVVCVDLSEKVSWLYLVDAQGKRTFPRNIVVLYDL